MTYLVFKRFWLPLA